ncbi:flagellar export protein FliJ [Calidifontibacillus oryziterrae]|uniref:flagellar export protein FliJ n=1 Tax=Calidifontibacillus oryziterrae TaxID=1191699 RepID=UPI0002FCEC97|nr:flagellar export protein FliJ [Calidifontibacillus oryziterrae]
MGFQYKFEKILAVKENEKDKAIGDYHESVVKFEEVATKLYNVLKQKEDIIAEQEQQIQTGLNIIQIQQLQRFLETLEQSINYWQEKVANARHHMEVKEKILLEKNIEVKKYEKMKQKAKLTFHQIAKVEENKLMDEISIQQFMNRGN